MESWLVVCCCFIAASTALAPDLAPIQWSGAMTDHPGEKHYHGLITRAQIHKDDVFLCIPRLRSGIEATLLKGSMRLKDRGRLEPYPAWKPQTEGDCNCLQSVVDIFLDPAGILWVLDTGATHVINPQPILKCPPKIVAYDVTTSKIEKEINLAGLVSPDSRLQFILTDYTPEGDCYIYVSDAGTGTIIVYDLSSDKGFKVPLPPAALPKIKDVLYLSLVRRPSGENFVYFTYRSGEDLFCISSRHLQMDHSCEKAWDAGKKPGKLTFLGTDDWESEYLRYENKTEVYKWNSATPFSESNFQIVDRGRTGLIPTHALTDYKRGVMRLMESNIVKYLHNGAKQEDAINSLKVMQLD